MLLVTNGRVVTRDDANPFVEDGAVLVDGEKVVEVGPRATLAAAHPEAEVVDAHGGVIMPGLINCHTHIYSGLARGLAIKGCNPTNFLENLEQQWWAIDRKLYWSPCATASRPSSTTTPATRRSRAPSLPSRT